MLTHTQSLTLLSPETMPVMMTFLSLKNIHRKRKGGVLKIDTEDKDKGGAEEAEPPQEELEKPTKAEAEDEAKEKKKSDDLWASFLSDVGSRPKESTPASQSSITQKVNMSYIQSKTAYVIHRIITAHFNSLVLILRPVLQCQQLLQGVHRQKSQHLLQSPSLKCLTSPEKKLGMSLLHRMSLERTIRLNERRKHTVY